jgi:hypothetical protein
LTGDIPIARFLSAHQHVNFAQQVKNGIAEKTFIAVLSEIELLIAPCGGSDGNS